MQFHNPKQVDMPLKSVKTVQKKNVLKHNYTKHVIRNVQ